MPLIALAVAAYAGGLILGFGGASVLALLLVVAVLVVAFLRRAPTLAALTAVAAAGAIVARATQASEQRCRARALITPQWTVTLADAAAPGAFVPGRARLGGCSVRMALAVQQGRGGAGAVVLVRGVAVASRRGIKIEHAVLAPVGRRSLTLALRARAGVAIDSVFRLDAPLVRALLIADTRSLDPALRDRFAAAGIVHMLSISGMHVAIIAAAILLIFQALRLPRTSATVATLAATAGYIALIGAPPAALRAAVMLGIGAVSRLMQRPVSPWAALALGAAIPLAEPRTVLDVGYQLSIIGMASLIAGGALARRWIVPRLAGWRAELAVTMLISVVATLACAPLVAWRFGRLSLIAPVTNVVAAPIVGVLQPTLFLALLARPVLPLARFLAGAAHPMIVALNFVARTGAGVPYGSIVVAPTRTAAMLAGVASAALLAACMSRFPGRALIVAVGSLTIVAWLPLVPAGAGDVELHVIDVGQGDAIALRTPHGHWVLVDAGRTWRGGDAGRSTVIPYLRRYGGDVVAFMLSHPHADHVGGAASVFRALHPAAYWDGAFAGGSEPYLASLLTARSVGVPWHRAHPGDTLRVDGVSMSVLAPDSAWMSTLDDPNEASLVVLVQFHAVRFLLVGDAERGEERWLLAHDSADLHADVLKVGHHGSSTSSTAPFLDAVRPRVAVISVGAGNSYGHPSASVVHALAARGAVVLRTDREGSIIIHTDGHHIRIEEQGDEWTLSPAS
ncbi:MAG TPA: DNA internalization-related competence protein ComEC/Rec2 [Gemmatimonadaceae bacterium]|nr:DNA internalization-related competence protein ComEC/Rec2 [Gemmatimonadaceae bacterium]